MAKQLPPGRLEGLTLADLRHDDDGVQRLPAAEPQPRLVSPCARATAGANMTRPPNWPVWRSWMTDATPPFGQPDLDAFYRILAARRDVRSGFLPDPGGDA